MQLLHAFQETKGDGMREHLKNWFGNIPFDLENEETGSYLACYCGGWVVPFSKNKEGETEVAVIWHNRKYTKYEKH